MAVTRFTPRGMGWHPDVFDSRDFTRENSEIQALIGQLRIHRKTRKKSVDLREFFPEVEDQGPLNSSCAFAVLGLIEYFEGRCCDPPLEASRLFLYQMALRLGGTKDDVGTDLRTALKAIRRFGAPPQHEWSYELDRFREAPAEPFLFCFADEFRHLRYFRPGIPAELTGGQDLKSQNAEETVATIKSMLAAGFPSILGFAVPTTLTSDGLISDSDRMRTLRGGQAVIAVGFDDSVRVGSHKGAVLIRNSWGSEWGDNGCGWLPYDVIGTRAAGDTWTIVSSHWVPEMIAW